MIIESRDWQAFLSEVNEITEQLPEQDRDRWIAIILDYSNRLGPIGMFEKFKGRRVADILLYPVSETEPLEKGELDELQYTLHAAPQTEDSDSHEEG